jgi:hypothetical protein
MAHLTLAATLGSKVRELGREGAAFGFFAPWSEEEAGGEGDGGEGYGSADAAEMADAGADEEGDGGADETGEGGGEGEGGGATFGGILFGEPEGVDGEIGAAESEEEKAEEKPGECVGGKVKNFAESQRDEDGHQGEEKSQGAAAAEALGEFGHGETAENGGEGDEHGGEGSEPRGLLTGAASGFGEGGNGGGNVHGTGPQAADRDDHEE